MQIKKKVYLDYAASTPIEKKVLELMTNVCLDEELQANPSSLHHFGRLAQKKINENRQKVAGVLGVSAEEIIFTGSGSESDNLAILGVARANAHQGKHLIFSAIEHKAIMEIVKTLQTEGFEVSLAPVDKNGVVIMSELLALVRSDTILISIMMVNNEVGTIQNIKKITRQVNKLKNGKNFPLFHTDACQAINILEVQPKKLGVDLLTLNGAKSYGPKGMGLLYNRKGVKLEPVIYGGGQEFALRAGTENLAGIVGLAEAIKVAQTKFRSESMRMVLLKKKMLDGLKKIVGVSINSSSKNCAPNILNFSVVGIEGESLLLELDYYGIAVSTGSACSARDLKPSYVLLATGKSLEVAQSSIRLSIGRQSTKKEIEYFLKILPQAIARLQKITIKNQE